MEQLETESEKLNTALQELEAYHDSLQSAVIGLGMLAVVEAMIIIGLVVYILAQREGRKG